MENQSIIVFTHRNIEFLTKLNGSTSWSLNSGRAMKCEYVICTRNRNNPLADNDFDHGSAFLIGKITNVTQALNLPRDEHRYMIEFNEYAEVSIPKFWKGWRSPVIYKNTKELGIDFDLLDWQFVPDRDEDFIYKYFAHENKYYDNTEVVSSNFKKRKLEAKKNTEGISISEAKEGLSEYYEIDKDNIEIILKG